MMQQMCLENETVSLGCHQTTNPTFQTAPLSLLFAGRTFSPLCRLGQWLLQSGFYPFGPVIQVGDFSLQKDDC